VTKADAVSVSAAEADTAAEIKTEPAAPAAEAKAADEKPAAPAEDDDFEKMLRESIVKHDQMKKDRDTTDND
jgi:hypothetical protein